MSALSQKTLLFQLLLSTPTVEAVERIFTWGVSFSYLCGFASMYIQIDGLQGNKGIIPMSKRRLKYTSRLFNNKQFKKKPDMVIDILCLSGMILSFSSVVHRKYRTMLDMSLLWYMYSMLKPDDPPLLEDAGFLACLVTPMFRLLQSSTTSSRGNISMYFTGLVENATHVGLVTSRWLLFVLMFESGTAKLLAGINEWWNLSGLKSHLQSQPYPTPLSRFLSLNLPNHYLRFSTGMALTMESFVPMLFLYPLQQYEILRTVAFYVQLVFQSGINVMGNFGFFNILTMFLSCTILTPSLSERHQSSNWLVTIASRLKTSPLLGPLIPILAIGNILSKGFNISIERLTPRYFVKYVSSIYSYGMFVTFIELFYAVRKTIGMAIWFDYKQPSVVAAIHAASSSSARTSVLFLYLKIYIARIMSVITSTAALSFFISSCVQSTSLIEKTIEASQKPRSVTSIRGMPPPTDRENTRLVLIRRELGMGKRMLQWRWPRQLVYMAQYLQQHCGLLNSYALFVNLTNLNQEQCRRHGFESVGGRLELILEASYNRQNGYKEIPFAHKPNGVDLNFLVAPHHPILEYQLWQATNQFVFNRIPFPKWFETLMSRILNGEDDITTLLDREKFYQHFEKGKPPKYIRAAIYLYRFTDETRSQGREVNGEDSDDDNDERVVWERDRVRTLEILSRDQINTNPNIANDFESKYGVLSNILLAFRKFVSRNWMFRRGRFVWGAILFIFLSRYVLFPMKLGRLDMISRFGMKFRYVGVLGLYLFLKYE